MDPFESLSDYERLSTRWTDREHRDGDISRYRYNEYTAVVQDLDGDGHSYSVCRGETLLHSGRNDDYWGGATFALVESYLVAAGALWAPVDHITRELIADRARLEEKQ